MKLHEMDYATAFDTCVNNGLESERKLGGKRYPALFCLRAVGWHTTLRTRERVRGHDLAKEEGWGPPFRRGDDLPP